MFGRRPKTCRITRRDHSLILCETLRWPNKETGGDLWGEWEQTYCVVKAISGPGEKARHEVTAFYQDEDYMERAGKFLYDFQAYHIGTWHSHHRIGLPRPSAGDSRTYANAMRLYRKQMFIAFISAIENDRPVLRPYFYYAEAPLIPHLGEFEFIPEDMVPQNLADKLQDLVSTPTPRSWFNDPFVKDTLKSLMDTLNAKVRMNRAKSNIELTFVNASAVESKILLSANFLNNRTLRVQSQGCEPADFRLKDGMVVPRAVEEIVGFLNSYFPPPTPPKDIDEAPLYSLSQSHPSRIESPGDKFDMQPPHDTGCKQELVRKTVGTEQAGPPSAKRNAPDAAKKAQATQEEGANNAHQENIGHGDRKAAEKTPSLQEEGFNGPYPETIGPGDPKASEEIPSVAEESAYGVDLVTIEVGDPKAVKKTPSVQEKGARGVDLGSVGVVDPTAGENALPAQDGGISRNCSENVVANPIQTTPAQQKIVDGAAPAEYTRP